MPDIDVVARNTFLDYSPLIAGYPSAPTAVLIGDSISQYCGYTPYQPGIVDPRSWIAWASALNGGNVNIIANLAVSGTTADQILLTVPAAIQYNPSIVTVLAGTNDLGLENDTSAQVIDTLRQIYQALIAVRIYVVALTILPRSLTGIAPLTAAQLGQILQINNWIVQYWRNNTGGECVDAYSTIVDPASTTLQALSGTLSDGVHPTNLGAYLIGVAVAGAFAKFAANSQLPSCVGDNFAANALSSILNTNPTFQGTGGTSSTGITGTVPTSYTAVCTGSTTAVGSAVASPDGIGEALKLVVTAAAAGDVCELSQTTNIVVPAGGIAAGQQYYCEALVTLAASPTNLSEVSIWSDNGFNSNYSSWMFNYPVTNIAYPSTLPATSLVLRTPLQTIGQFQTAIRFAPILLGFAGAGGCTATVSRAAVRYYTNPSSL